MNALIESITGMNKMSDQVIATDFLIAAKSGVRNYAIALTETTNSEVRIILRKHLKDAINTHEKIFNYMVDRGYYSPYNMEKQLEIDTTTADTALNLTESFL
jgi:similar to spore coat protein